MVVEKPFGRDSESSEKLSKDLMAVLKESEARSHISSCTLEAQYSVPVEVPETSFSGFS